MLNLCLICRVRTAVTTTVKESAHSMGKHFLKEMTDGRLKHGGAVSVDRVHLKANANHYLDFTVHFMCIKRDNAQDEPTFPIENKWLMLVEGPEVPRARNIRQKLEVALLRK